MLSLFCAGDQMHARIAPTNGATCLVFMEPLFNHERNVIIGYYNMDEPPKHYALSERNQT